MSGDADAATSSPPRSSTRRCSTRATDPRPSVTVVGVDREGRFDAADVLDAIRPDTALVSVQLANHEVGTIQHAVAEICAAARAAGVLVHVDACAAAGHVPVDFAALGADLCSVTRSPVGRTEGRRPRCSCAAGCGSRRSSSAARRSAPGAVASRTSPAIVGLRRRRGRAARRRSPHAEATRRPAPHRRDRGRRDRGRRRRALRRRRSDARFPNLVCLGLAGVEAEPIAARARPARRRRALRLVVLERAARAVTRAASDGRRRRPFVARRASGGRAPTPTSSSSRRRSRS